MSKEKLNEVIQEQIGECIGLERAAQQAVEELESRGLLDSKEIRSKMDEMKQQAGSHEQKMEQAVQRVVESMDLDMESIEEFAEETVQKATTMMETYLGEEPETQDALEFLCLAEGGEVTHYEVLTKLLPKIKDQKFAAAVNSILKQEKRHLATCTKLAKQNVTQAG
ncbi:MAG: hypothetical protein ABI361_04820 [Nitrososphaera sp.]